MIIKRLEYIHEFEFNRVFLKSRIYFGKRKHPKKVDDNFIVYVIYTILDVDELVKKFINE